MSDEGPVESHGLDELQARLGITFRDTALLRQALVHGSVATEPAGRLADGTAVETNERLEFLGDAVVGLVAAAYLYRAFPDLSEGQLTIMRSALVRRTTLARFAERLELARYVQVGRSEEINEARARRSVLAEAYEAVLGAIFLDSGFAAAAGVAEADMAAEVPHVLAGGAHRNHKSLLQELTQALQHITPRYRLLERSGPAHDSRFVAEVDAGPLGAAQGEGASKQEAEQAAAALLLDRLEAARARRGEESVADAELSDAP
jgi:ribonuclease-3